MSTTVAMPKLAADDSQQFDRWFREYHLLVHRTAYFITGNSEDAQDILQTIFLRLMRRSVPPDIVTNPKGYFYTAAVNLSLDTIRLKRREVLTSDFPLSGVQVHAETSYVRDALHKRVIEMLAKLTPRTAQIVTLRYVHDYTEPEIAKLLRISRSTVSVTLFRARIRLRKLLRASSRGVKL